MAPVHAADWCGCCAIQLWVERLEHRCCEHAGASVVVNKMYRAPARKHAAVCNHTPHDEVQRGTKDGVSGPSCIHEVLSGERLVGSTACWLLQPVMNTSRILHIRINIEPTMHVQHCISPHVRTHHCKG